MRKRKHTAEPKPHLFIIQISTSSLIVAFKHKRHKNAQFENTYTSHKTKKKNNLLGEKKQNPDTKMSINNHQTKNQQETPQIIASCHSLCMLKTRLTRNSDTLPNSQN